MHNNGTTPQIILPDNRLLPDLTPKAGLGIQVTPSGVVLTLQMGELQLPMCLPPDQATQVGVGLISAAAVLQKAIHDAAQAEQPHIIAPSEPEPEPAPEPEDAAALDPTIIID
jgi:hypothetical protein